MINGDYEMKYQVKVLVENRNQSLDKGLLRSTDSVTSLNFVFSWDKGCVHT